MVSKYACIVLIISLCVLIMPPFCLEELACAAASCYNLQLSRVAVACVCVRACPRTKGWRMQPYVSCYTQVCMCVHARLWFACVSLGPAHVSVAQTGAADGHAETCSVLHRDIFGLLCYCERGCWSDFLFKTKWFFSWSLRLDCLFSSRLLTFYS